MAKKSRTLSSSSIGDTPSASAKASRLILPSE